MLWSYIIYFIADDEDNMIDPVLESFFIFLEDEQSEMQAQTSKVHVTVTGTNNFSDLYTSYCLNLTQFMDC